MGKNTIIETYSGMSFCGPEMDVSKYKTKLTLREFLVERLEDDGYDEDYIEKELSGENYNKHHYGITEEVGEDDTEVFIEGEMGHTTLVWIEG